MKKSNIFAFIELSKFVEALSIHTTPVILKDKLNRQSSYFKVIDAKYFSAALVDEWIDIQKIVSSKGIKRDDNGLIEMNAIRYTIESFSDSECSQITQRLILLLDRLKYEFE